MKSSHILTLGISSIAITTVLHLGSSDTTPKEESDLSPENNQPKVSEIITEKKRGMWEILDDATARADSVTKTIPSERDQLIELINNNPTLRIRIQGMSWYRDFISGKYVTDEIKKHIADAMLLEEIIKSDPDILMRIQHLNIWQNYLNGSIPPHNIIHGEIPAILYMDTFSKENSHIFSQIQRNPMFQRNSNDTETTFSEKKSTIEGLLAQEKALQDNPTLRAKFEQYGYTQASIYMSDWRDGRQSGFFAVNDAIYALEDPKQFAPEVWKQFQDSDVGAQYRSGTIDPREAFRYINDIAIKTQY